LVSIVNIIKVYKKLKIPANSMKENILLEEIREMDTPLCEIERIAHLAIDMELTNFEHI